MDWSIDIPFKDRDELVLNTIPAAREKFGEDDHRTRVTEVIATDALADGVTTVGALLDQIEKLSPTEARDYFDQARVKAGLKTTRELDKRHEDAVFERELERVTPPPPPRWNKWQGCMAKGCRARPVTSTGALRPVSCERWWCDEHKHLAAEGDLEEHEGPYTGQFTLGGRPIPTEKEKARIAAWHEERREKEERLRRGREEQRRAEGEAIEKAKQDYADTAEISVMGIRVRPDLRRIQ